MNCPKCNNEVPYAEGSRPGTVLICTVGKCGFVFAAGEDGTATPCKANRSKAKKKPAADLESEAGIQESIAQYLKTEGWLPVRVNSGRFQVNQGPITRWIFCYFIYGIDKAATKFAAWSGFPDLLALRGCSFLLLEVKTPTGEYRAAQKAFAEYVRRYGITVHTARSVADVQAILYSE